MHWPFGKTRLIKCPDGSLRYVYKNMDDAFPLYAKDWKARFDVAVKGLQTIQGSLGGELAHGLSGLLVMLNESNASLQFNCRAIYCTFSVNPCSMDTWLQNQMQELINPDNSGNRVLEEIGKIDRLWRNGASKE